MGRITTVIENLIITILEGIVDRIMRRRYPLIEWNPETDNDPEMSHIVSEVNDMIIEPEDSHPMFMSSESTAALVKFAEAAGQPELLRPYCVRDDEAIETLEEVAEEALDEPHYQDPEKQPKPKGADITVLYPDRKASSSISAVVPE